MQSFLERHQSDVLGVLWTGVEHRLASRANCVYFVRIA